MPLTSKTFSQLIDFTRTSAATYVDQLGRIVPTPVSPNLLTFTQELDNAAWTKVGATVSAGDILAPDGTRTAEKVVETAVSSRHGVNQSVVSVAAPYTLTVYARPAENTFLALSPGGSGQTNAFTWFNLVTGAVGTNNNPLATIESAGGGWYRCSITFMAISGTLTPLVEMAKSNNTNSYLGDGTSGIFIWGAQLEQTPDANLTLGSELVTNGDFAGGSTGWTVNTGWAVGSGVATATATNASLISGSAVTANKTYRVAFDVTSYTSGTLSVRVGTGTAQTVTGAGSKVLYLTATNTAGVEFYGGGITLSVDNISVREVTAASPSTYTRNFGGRFPPRFDYDPVTLAPRGLLIEEQRTNLFTRSEEFDNAAWVKAGATVTANAATSPDGTVDADALVEDGTTGLHLAQQFFTFLNATAYTVSVFIKPSTRTWVQVLLPAAAFTAAQGGFFNLTGAGSLGIVTGTPTSRSITAVGNGWYRITITATSTAAAGGNIAVVAASADGTTSYAGTNGATALFPWGAQLEAGAFATSYIPTTTSQVTRTADSAAITGANFSSWYNPSEGTFLVEYIPYSTTTQTAVFAVNDFTSNNRIDYRTVFTGVVTVGGAAQAVLLPASSTPSGAIHRIGIAYKANDFAASANGGAVTTDNSGTLPAVNRLLIGALDSGALPLNGYIRSIRYYPTRLTNAQLQALTA